MRGVLCVDVEIYINLWCGIGRLNFFDIGWSGGEFLAGGDGRRCPNRFYLLGCPVRLCSVSIGVLCALHSFLFIPIVWVIIVIYKCIFIFLGRS